MSFVVLEALQWLPLTPGQELGLPARWRVPLSYVDSWVWSRSKYMGPSGEPSHQGKGLGLHASEPRVQSRSREDSGTEWEQRFGAGILGPKAGWQEAKDNCGFQPAVVLPDSTPVTGIGTTAHSPLYHCPTEGSSSLITCLVICVYITELCQSHFFEYHSLVLFFFFLLRQELYQIFFPKSTCQSPISIHILISVPFYSGQNSCPLQSAGAWA